MPAAAAARSFIPSRSGRRAWPRATKIRLLLRGLTQAADRAAQGERRGGVLHVRAARHHLAAAVALPNANSHPLDAYFAAELAEVLAVLRHLDLLDALTKHSTIARAELAGDSDLLGALGLLCREE